MSLTTLKSAALDGIESRLITVEVDVSPGLPSFQVVGLADKAVEESKERVRSAIRQAGFSMPLARITVNLAPSELHKSGIHFDLAIALGIIIADNQLKPTPRLKTVLCAAGLLLNGQVQPINGALIMAETAKANNLDLLLPLTNLAEASIVPDVSIVPIENLRQAIEYLIEGTIPVYKIEPRTPSLLTDQSWAMIRGQDLAKRAAVVAAAGHHHLLLEGPPGAGKTMLAKALRSILPPLSEDERAMVIKLHSVSGLLNPVDSITAIGRPFRTPHHSASHVSLIGGGANPKPGEISLAHQGVLLLDELPEYQRVALESLRQPLEDKIVTVSRVQRSVRYPADFLLVATMNPCPCGWLHSGVKDCQCNPGQIASYRTKISGPILDRIDLYLRLPPVPIKQMSGPTDESGYQEATKSVERAFQRQLNRQGKRNGQLSVGELERFIQLSEVNRQFLVEIAEKLTITGRGYHRLIKVAQTIADLAEREQIERSDILEAAQYRQATL